MTGTNIGHLAPATGFARERLSRTRPSPSAAAAFVRALLSSAHPADRSHGEAMHAQFPECSRVRSKGFWLAKNCVVFFRISLSSRSTRFSRRSRSFSRARSRSEEHTSELQSLMRISYAVFCLKKTKQDNTP